MDEPAEDHVFVRQCLCAVSEETQSIACALEWVCGDAAPDRGTDGMQPEFEGSHDAEVAAAATQGPEQIG